jgi:hypothetical protein
MKAVSLEMRAKRRTGSWAGYNPAQPLEGLSPFEASIDVFIQVRFRSSEAGRHDVEYAALENAPMGGLIQSIASQSIIMCR